MLTTYCYRPPSDAIKGINSYLENVFKKTNTDKLCLVLGDFDLNCLDYNEDFEIRTFTIEFLHMVAFSS